MQVDRRHFLQTGFACASGALLASRLQAAGEKPNIIYILADDLGYGDLSSYGQTKFQTPNIDRLGTEGIRFTQHYAGSTVCAPSRCSVMTGLHTGHARVRGNWEVGPHGFGAGLELRGEDVTVAEVLQGAGYKTAVIGKWGLGVEGTTGEPNKKGFDYSFGYLNQGHAHSHYPDKLFRNGKEISIDENRDGKRGVYANDLVSDEALQFIRANKTLPFFLYLTFTLPHAETLAPEDSMTQFRGRFEEIPFPGQGRYSPQHTPKAAVAAMITRLDSYVGKLLDEVKKQGLDEKTLVLFTSDNGPHQEGGHDPAFFNSSGGLRGIKRDLYEGGIRVPLLARWPGHIKPGRVSHHVSAFWDFMPTAAELAGANLQTPTDGISFLPELLGGRQRRHQSLYWEFHEVATTVQAVRFGDWKAIRKSPSGPVELYNLRSDFAETKNLARAHPDIEKRATQILNISRSDHPIWPLKNAND